MKKRLLGYFLVGLLFSIVIIACAGHGKRTLRIFHTTDIHVRGILNTNLTYSQIAAYVATQKEKHPDTLFLDAGDAVQGLSFSDVSKGMNMIEIMNLMNYDAMTLGNHEFDFGAAHITDLIQNATFPIVGANFLKDNAPVIPPYVTYQMDGINIAIVGALSADMEKLLSAKNRGNYRFPNPIPVLQTLIPELRKTSDIIIVLAHMGASGDTTSIDLAKNVPGIDLIVDGHDHVPLPQGNMVGNTLIVNSGENAEYLGRVDLILKNNKIISKKAHLLTKKDLQSAGENETITDLIQSLTAKYQEQLDALRGPVIAQLPQVLDGHRSSVRTGETTLTNLLTDSVLAAAQSDVVLMSSGGIRTSLNNGPITAEDIYNVIPFGDDMVVIELSGAQLQDALEYGFTEYPKTIGAFPQFAGMQVSVDSKKSVGSRVQKITINGEDINPTQTYSVTTSTYLQGGGDGYEITKKPIVRRVGLLKDIFTAYLLEKLKEPNGLQTTKRLSIK